MVKIFLDRQFKNHPRGSCLDVSKRIHDMLLEKGFISKPKPVPLVFAPDVLKAAKDLGTKEVSKKKLKEKK